MQLNWDSEIAAIRQLRVSQAYGDPLYTKFAPSSLIRFYGFTGFAMGTVTRQVVEAFNIASYLFPAPYLPDVIDRDINAHALTFLEANGARLGIFLNPIAQNTQANIYGLLEMDFSGIEPETAYIAKIRHAFGEIIWHNGAFLFGQYYHPLFLRNCFPRTVNYNMGAPYEPQALVPQVRVSQRFSMIELTLTAAGEAYIKSWGPFLTQTVGQVQSLVFIQNAIVPNWNLEFKWLFENTGFVGWSFDYKRLVPRLVSFNNFKVSEHIDSVIAEVFSHNVFYWGQLNCKVVYSQNGSDQLLISGFAVDTVDPITDYRTYSNTAAFSGWLDIYTVFFYDLMTAGLFVGGTVNLGASHALYTDPTSNQPIVYALDGLAQLLAHSVRVSPRFSYGRNAFRFGIELTWDLAAFGTLDDHARVIDAIPVNAFSYLVSIDYVF